MKPLGYWPYKGHMRPNDHADFPDGCKGNCDGVCEGYGRDRVVEKFNVLREAVEELRDDKTAEPATRLWALNVLDNLV